MTANSGQIDYSPLHQPVTPADVAAYKQYVDGPQASKSKWGKPEYILAGLVGLIGVWFLIGSLLDLFTKGKISGLFWLIAMIGGALLIYKSWVAYTRRLAKLYKFAMRNNITLKIALANHGLAGIIFNQGSSRQVSEAYMFTNGSEIGNYQYTTGSGKNRTTHEWGYVRVSLARNLPNMILDAKSNNLIGRLSNLPIAFNKNTKLQLEGDFNKYFDLYVPAEYERDALYVFTPDVMAALVNSGAAYDMEIIDNSLMIYRSLRFNLASEQELGQIFSIVNTLAKEIRDQSNYYSDERIGSRAQNTVAEPGKRLKHGFGKSVSIIVAIIFIIIVIFQAFSILNVFMNTA